MAVINGHIGTRSEQRVEVLNTLGSFPYRQNTVAGPETLGVANVISIATGDALKRVAGVISKYVTGDTENICGIAAAPYDSTDLHSAGSPAGYIDMYTFGCMRKSMCYMDNGAGVRIELTSADIEKAVLTNLYIE